MVSPKQVAANQRNALASTGPKTADGKLIASKNSVKHGLTSCGLLPDEDPEVFEGFADRMRTDLAPVGELEDLLAERIVSSSWRLRRVSRVEAGVLAWEHFSDLISRARAEAGKYEENFLAKACSVTETRITNEEAHKKALQEAQDFVEAQRASDTKLGLAFARRAASEDTFSKLSRYEASLERSLYRALHELQRLQALRAGQKVPVPVAVNVSINGAGAE